MAYLPNTTPGTAEVITLPWTLNINQADIDPGPGVVYYRLDATSIQTLVGVTVTTAGGSVVDVFQSDGVTPAVGELEASQDFRIQQPVTPLNTYYFSNAIRTKLLAGTATAIDTRVVDPAGIRAYIVDLPRVKLTDGTPEGIQVDSDRTLNAQFMALKDPTLGFTIQMSRFEQFA